MALKRKLGIAAATVAVASGGMLPVATAAPIDAGWYPQHGTVRVDYPQAVALTAVHAGGGAFTLGNAIDHSPARDYLPHTVTALYVAGFFLDEQVAEAAQVPGGAATMEWWVLDDGGVLSGTTVYP